MPPKAATEVAVAGLALALGALVDPVVPLGAAVVLLEDDFVLDPLPNLAFTRDSSFWIGDQLGVASLASERRRREAGLVSVIYRRHPRFAGTRWLYQQNLEHLDGVRVLEAQPWIRAGQRLNRDPARIRLQQRPGDPRAFRLDHGCLLSRLVGATAAGTPTFPKLYAL